MKKTILWAIGALLLLCVAACSGGSGQRDGGDPDGSADGQDGGDEGPASCDPACPTGATCQDLDGLGAPECVTAEGQLACRDAADCPADGDCIAGLCVRMCGCASDADCAGGAKELICRTEDIGCGVCLEASAFDCLAAEDCRWVVDVSLCCPCPKARNAAAADQEACLVPFGEQDDPPAGCTPDCSAVDHCWPCTSTADASICRRGFCQAGL